MIAAATPVSGFWVPLISLGVAVAMLLLNLGGLIAMAVWVVGKIRGDALAVKGSIDSLAKTVGRLADKLENHGDRLARLETRAGHTENKVDRVIAAQNGQNREGS